MGFHYVDQYYAIRTWLGYWLWSLAILRTQSQILVVLKHLLHKTENFVNWICQGLEFKIDFIFMKQDAKSLPLVRVEWYACDMNMQSTDANRQARDNTRIWNKSDILGERSMKSTRSSANQWKDFRNRSRVNSATNFGEKSSLLINKSINYHYWTQTIYTVAIFLV